MHFSIYAKVLPSLVILYLGIVGFMAVFSAQRFCTIHRLTIGFLSSRRLLRIYSHDQTNLIFPKAISISMYKKCRFLNFSIMNAHTLVPLNTGSMNQPESLQNLKKPIFCLAFAVLFSWLHQIACLPLYLLSISGKKRVTTSDFIRHGLIRNVWTSEPVSAVLQL